MVADIFTLQSYTIRRKILKLFGAGFHVYDAHGDVVGYSSQRAFKLKEDIRLYSDESRSQELLTIRARQIVDFAAAYDVMDSRAGRKVGAARRRGFRSIMRDAWDLLDADERQVAHLEEDSTTKALLRRFLSNLIPQIFHLRSADGVEQATMRQHFNPLVYRMTVTRSPSSTLDPRLVLGTAILVAAIEGRQG